MVEILKLFASKGFFLERVVLDFLSGISEEGDYYGAWSAFWFGCRRWGIGGWY